MKKKEGAEIASLGRGVVFCVFGGGWVWLFAHEWSHVGRMAFDFRGHGCLAALSWNPFRCFLNHCEGIQGELSCCGDENKKTLGVRKFAMFQFDGFMLQGVLSVVSIATPQG